MQYALLNGIKTEAIKGEQAVCIGCGEKVIAKCGPIKIHHWAHAVLCKCDSWWESETLWHREWKEKFKPEFREINFYDQHLCEFHRADIHTENGVTIEFQNSPISIAELQSREQFYPKLIWIVNGLKFKRFKIIKNIPNPHDALLVDYEFCNSEHLSVIKKSDVLAGIKKPKILNFHDGNLKNISFRSDFYSFSWRNVHQAWLHGACPIFIDLGGLFLYRLRTRFQYSENYSYLQLIKKNDFLAKYSS